MLSNWIAAHPADAVFLSGPDGDLTYGDLKNVGRDEPGGQVVIFPDNSLATAVDLMTLPGEQRQVVLIDPRLPSDEIRRRRRAAAAGRQRRAATIVFTSGSTGPAKAVRLTEANWSAAAAASAAHLDHQPEDVWLAVMPLHHVGGLSILYRSAFVGATVRWLPRFEVAAVIEALRGGVTMASLVPTMLRRVLDHDAGRYDNLRAVLVGGGPIPSGLLEEAGARGIPALPSYGMTETSAQVATLRPGSATRYAAHPLPGVEVRIGEDERIQVRGPQVSPGYADADDSPPGEWFTTPDLGRLDPDGAVRVLGRADDIIVTGGENVNPARVEAVLSAHAGVSAVVAVGIADPTWGQRVAAAYAGTVSAEDLTAWARLRLAAAEMPRTVLRVAVIPTGGLGKPDRQAVREMFV